MADPAQQQVAYPEHEKLKSVKHLSQGIHDFLEWLEEQGISLGKRHTHTVACYDGEKYPKCGSNEDELYDHMENREKLIARFFDIDLRRLDDEKRDMLEECRRAHEERRNP